MLEEQDTTVEVSSGGQPSESDSANQPKTITITEAELSDRLSKAGSEKVVELQRKIRELEQAQADKEYDEAKAKLDLEKPEDKAKLTNLDAKKRIRSLEDRIKELEPYEVIARQVEKDRQARDDAVAIASNYEGGDANELIAYTDGSKERMDALAKRLWSVKPVQNKGTRTDSGLSKGGSTSIASLDPKERVKATEAKLREITR